MSNDLQFVTNVICPLLSGIPLLCFALYFFYASQGLFKQRTTLFPIFLLGFSLYVLGRPIQLFVGPYPWPVVVNCLRALLFLGVCCPLVLHEARALSKAPRSNHSLKKPLSIGLGLACVYMITMGVGAHATPPVFELGTLKAYDALVPSFSAPLFAREITILIQAFAGLGFFGLAGYETLSAHRRLPKSEPNSRHLFYFAIGCIIFGTSLALGALTKQWWFYYLASVPAVFFIGLGVREDMLYTSQRVERATPFLRDELFHALSGGPSHDAKVRDLKELLGKEVSPTLVMVILPGGANSEDVSWLLTQETTRQHLADWLDQTLGHAQYLLLPMGTGHFGVCLDTDEAGARNLADSFFRSLAQGPGGSSFMIGIGGRHASQELQYSYLEAQTALRAAKQSGEPRVSYVDLGSLSTRHQFPVEARDEFLLEFKHGHKESATRRLKILLEQMVIHADGDAVLYRVQLLELLGTLLGQLDPTHAQSPALLTEAASAFEKLTRLNRPKDLSARFTATIAKLLSYVEPPKIETSSGNPLQRAKVWIAENLDEDIKVADVAKRAGVSTSQLQRTFREAMDMTFSAYLAKVRMTKAKELLAGTDEPITSIAFDVGYNDSNYFSTAFRKYEGISPRQYRKQSAAN